MQDAPVVNVREELAGAPVTRTHVVVAGLIALVLFFDGYDVFNPSYVIHYVMKPWHLAPGSAGFLVSAGLIGFTIGAIAQGPIADRYGRRRTLIGGLWVASVFSLATAFFGNGFWPFCLLRFFTGLGLGVLMPLGVTFVNEIAPRRIANTFSTLGWLLGWAAGGTVASIVGVFLTPSFGWPVLYLVGSLSFVLAIALAFLLPESPQSMVVRGDVAGIAALLARLNPPRAEHYRDARFTIDEDRSRKGSIALLFAPRYRRNTIVIWISAFLLLFALFGLTGWVPTVMMQRGEGFVASFAFGALLQVMSLLGQLAGGAIADRTGDRRSVIMTWWTLGALSVVVLALFGGHAVDLVCTAAAGFFVIGGQGLLSNFTAHVYETEVRATGVGMELGVGRLGGILGPYVVGLLQEFVPGSAGMFGAIALATFASVIVLAFAREPRALAGPMRVAGAQA
ncbi:MAG TPA: MFS transporter [Candidatus Limnocylindria bacterium]|nr:MFS transporter [Candidatus Limnocylindria bacterium]